MNLHTVLRLLQSVFAPYTSITTNVLFFLIIRGPLRAFGSIAWIMPEGYKHFSKTKPIRIEHFAPVKEWWENRRDIEEDGNPKAKFYTVEERETAALTLTYAAILTRKRRPYRLDELLGTTKKSVLSSTPRLTRSLPRICEILWGEA